MAAYDALFQAYEADWFIREVRLFARRALKRLDITSRTSFAFVEPGSCFSGLLAELLFAVDRTYMLDGCLQDDPNPAPTIMLSPLNFGYLKMANGLTRLETRFLGEPESVDRAKQLIGQPLEGLDALDAGLVTFAPDEIDWEDEIRLLLEERAEFFARCAYRYGSQPALRRTRNDRVENLWPPQRMAKLDIPTAQRGRRGWCIEALRYRPPGSIRSKPGLAPGADPAPRR